MDLTDLVDLLGIEEHALGDSGLPASIWAMIPMFRVLPSGT